MKINLERLEMYKNKNVVLSYFAGANYGPAAKVEPNINEYGYYEAGVYHKSDQYLLQQIKDCNWFFEDDHKIDFDLMEIKSISERLVYLSNFDLRLCIEVISKIIKIAEKNKLVTDKYTCALGYIVDNYDAIVKFIKSRP